ncbi:MAG: Phosphoribosylaminoimidazole-succinocarboxamide synthase [Alphaproteobacteria bacterium MarineAlpha9_Bin4]|nr:phosphoribosylaminoimidazolesuccinocarboxamide synthase [Pelagibacterales bacterium]PPR27001.1 MAG: Phosphoribosylaminoimidazole-succinocarboxamide synthase [Alphaproteobacteria bacterium MarineAlpha9_Bin4]|tara:strand:+ start:2469 stop:3179 length:711 start_codon:yes stop_codon:yes gene_type:complete
MKLVLEGKAKKIFQSENKSYYIQYFKDSATAFNNKKKRDFNKKGIINNLISSDIFIYLNKNNIRTHFVKKISEREQLIKKVDIIPVEVVVRNYAAGSLVKRLAIKKGKKLKTPLIEFYFKCDELDDPFISDDHITLLNLANRDDIKKIKKVSIKINNLLIKYFRKINFILVDYKLEFGILNKKIILADEISPDSCRLWDIKTKISFDKDIFRENKGNLLKSYNEIIKRLKIEVKNV